MIDDSEHDRSLLRSLLARELETINQYRKLARRTDAEHALTFFNHVVEEEKVHVAQVLEAIAKIDDSQSHLIQIGFPEDHEPGEIPHASAPDARTEGTNDELGSTSVHKGGVTGLTVGSLRGAPQ